MMTPRRYLMIVLSALLLLATPAMAGGFEWQVQGYYLVDLIILLALAGAFVKGPAKQFLETRYESARQEMTEAMAVKTEAENRLSKYETALSNLDTEISELNDAFKKDGEGEAARIAAQGDADAEKLRRDAAETIAREGNQLKNDIERAVAVQAIARAESMIRDRITDERHSALIQAFIVDLESREDLGSFTS